VQLRNQLDFVKAYLQMFVPYESVFFFKEMKDYTVKGSEIEAINSKHDFEAIASIFYRISRFGFSGWILLVYNKILQSTFSQVRQVQEVDDHFIDNLKRD